MSPFIAAFLAIIGALCLALSGYYTALCYATDYKTLNKLVLAEADEPKADNNCKNAKAAAWGFGIGGLAATAGALFILWPKGRRANAQAARPSLAELRARYAKAEPNVAASDYAKSIKAALE